MKFIANNIQTQITMSFSEQEMSSSEQETVPIFRSTDLLAISVEDSSIPPPNLQIPYLNGDELSRLQDVFFEV